MSMYIYMSVYCNVAQNIYYEDTIFFFGCLVWEFERHYKESDKISQANYFEWKHVKKCNNYKNNYYCFSRNDLLFVYNVEFV